MSMQSEAPKAAQGSDSKISLAYSYYVLGILFTVYVFNFIDRQVLAILLQPIKQDLQASDTAMGFLAGFAFVVFYTFAGIPIARFADRTSRRSVIAAGLAVWSAMTAASGLARSFTQLALARVGVGIGEAAGSPPAHSLLSDYFPPERRATALSIYATGVYVGAMIAFMAGGYIREHFGWRLVYLVVGLPGIPLALLVRMTVRELPRGFSESGPADTRVVGIGEVLRFLLSRRSFLYIAAGASCQSLGGYAILSWGPAFLERVHQMPVVEVGTWLGLCVGVGGSAGAYLGGKLADRLGSRDPSWYMRLPAMQAVLGVPFVAAFLLLQSPKLALICFFPFYFIANMYIGPMLAMTQGLVRLRMRATASAILLFILNMVGLGAGSFVVGFLNDQFAGRFGIEAIRYSLLAVALVGGLASLFFLQASRTLPQDLHDRDT
jgi:predicted MFS family arabinose efflux permease